MSWRRGEEGWAPGIGCWMGTLEMGYSVKCVFCVLYHMHVNFRVTYTSCILINGGSYTLGTNIVLSNIHSQCIPAFVNGLRKNKYMYLFSLHVHVCSIWYTNRSTCNRMIFKNCTTE